jgi:glycerol-3-phosphate acyltransferase PlsY
MSVPALLGAIVIGYILGAIPFGYLFVRLTTGRDVTQEGSGRIGGTNALRAGGPVAGILTGIGDLLKGALAVLIARALTEGQAAQPWAEALAGAAAVLGHNASIFIGFKGGAGSGPNVGAAAALWPWSALLIPATPILLFGTGYASVTSMTLALLVLLIFTVRAIQGLSPWAYVWGFALLTTILVFGALIPNIRRLLRGEERMVGPRARYQQKKVNAQKVSG